MSVVMDRYDVMEEQATLRVFNFVFGISQVVGAIAVILVAVWMGEKGFAWTENPSKEFQYHPLFMTIGMIFLYGEAILIYRVFRHERKKFTKLLHVVLHSFVFIFFVLALKAVFDSHNNKVDSQGRPAPEHNLYTLHSWVGLSTVLLFCLQYVCGFVSFFFPTLPPRIRQWYLPIHQFFGIAIFAIASATALMGISEKLAWANEDTCPAQSCSAGNLGKFTGLFILFYCLLVIYLVANPRFRRRALPEEESLQQLTAD